MKIIAQGYTKISLKYISESFGDTFRKMRLFSKAFNKSDECESDNLYDSWSIEDFVEAKIRDLYNLVTNFKGPDRNSERYSPLKIIYDKNFSTVIIDIKRKLSKILSELGDFVMFIEYRNFLQIEDFSSQNFNNVFKYSCLALFNSDNYRNVLGFLKSFDVSNQDVIEFQSENFGNINCSDFSE